MRSFWPTGIRKIAAALPLLAASADAWPGGTHTLSVTATVLSKSSCKFRPGAGTTLNFGALNPASPVDVSASLLMTLRCAGSAPQASFHISSNSGLYGAGPNALRMRNTGTPSEYLSYGLAFSPDSATVPKNTNQIITVTGTVKGTDYRNAAVGGYSDTVIITLLP
jgi:spore coat protein U-like protein